MSAVFLDTQDIANPMNGAEIADGTAVARLFKALRGRKPFFFKLQGRNGYTLLVGVGGPLTCAQYSRSDGEGAAVVAVAPHPARSVGEVEFLTGNTLTPVPGEYCMPESVVRSIVRYFVETGKRSADVAWETV